MNFSFIDWTNMTFTNNFALYNERKLQSTGNRFNITTNFFNSLKLHHDNIIRLYIIIV